MIKADISDNEILNLFNAARTNDDVDSVGKMIVDFYSKHFGGERSIFFAREGANGYRDIVRENMDEKFNLDYKEYYFKFDPLDLLGKKQRTQSPELGVQIIDYSGCEKSEYYSDFLEPQKIHYKMLVSLKSMNGIIGKLLLTNSKKKGSFTKGEVFQAEKITPYISQALEINSMRRELAKKNSLLEMIEDNLKTGVILLDSSSRLVHMNSRAQDFCRLIRNDSFNIKNLNDMHPMIIRDYLEMAEELSTEVPRDLILPRNRLLRQGDFTFSVQSKLIHDQENLDKSDYFLIHINRTGELQKADEITIPEIFKLSPREEEVANQVLQGLSNAEIAIKLYISEVTVKKHLQNIFLKMGISNRASLIKKVLTGQDA